MSVPIEDRVRRFAEQIESIAAVSHTTWEEARVVQVALDALAGTGAAPAGVSLPRQWMPLIRAVRNIEDEEEKKAVATSVSQLIQDRFRLGNILETPDVGMHVLKEIVGWLPPQDQGAFAKTHRRGNEAVQEARFDQLLQLPQLLQLLSYFGVNPLNRSEQDSWDRWCRDMQTILPTILENLQAGELVSAKDREMIRSLTLQ